LYLVEHWITQFLRFVDVTIINNEDCQAVYGDIINDSKLCIDTAGGTKGICFVSEKSITLFIKKYFLA